jgi:hypothetical protein
MNKVICADNLIFVFLTLVTVLNGYYQFKPYSLIPKYKSGQN